MFSLFVILVLAAIVRILFSPGFTGSDDVIYAIRGTEIASGIWRPTDYFGELRFGINIPIAFFVKILGANLVGFVAWSFVSSLAEIALVFVTALSVWGVRTAVLAGVLVALTPIHVGLGSCALADAPLAFLFTLAVVAFFFAERSRAKWLYFATGAAIGFSWWIKPIAAVPFALIFVIYALIYWRWRREWILVFLGGIFAVAIEFAVLWIQFGDPLYTIKANLAGVNHYFVKSDAPWGSHSPWYYFRQMFLDGRDMWIVPFLAIGGLFLVVRGETKRGIENAASGSRYICFWAISSVCMFSFFFYSVNPVKFIPKQANYALVFFAPLALLGGYALSRMKRIARAGALFLFILGAMPLSALWQLNDKLHFSAIEKTRSFAKDHPHALVFASSQVLASVVLENLSAGRQGTKENLRPIGALATDQYVNSGDSNKQQFAIVDPLSPETVQVYPAKSIANILATCWQKVTSFAPNGEGDRPPVVELLSQIRSRLPQFVDRHLSFTNKLISPPVVNVFEFKSGCSLSG